MCGLTVPPGSIASAILSKDINTTDFSLTPPLDLVDLWPFVATISAHCQPLLQPDHEQYLAVRVVLCHSLSCSAWKIPCTVWFGGMDGCGASCIGSVFVWLEAILPLGIFVVGPGFLMNLQLVPSKMRKYYLLTCEMKPSKHRIDNCVTSEASWKNEQFVYSNEANEWCGLDLAVPTMW